MTLLPLTAKWMLYFVFFYLGWIPAFAGMTKKETEMTKKETGMTKEDTRMTAERVVY
jgi:hypothetical protein